MEVPAIYNKITDDQIAMIRRYISYNASADQEASFDISDLASTEYLLREWARAKSLYLEKLFGDELILSKEITFSQGIDELMDKVWTDVLATNAPGYTFRSSFNRFCNTMVGKNCYDYLWRLLESDTLANNRYDCETFDIECPNDKTITVNRGCKVSKVLGKIAKEFNLEGYEEFRIALSQALNQKALNGTLCLSIHPFDYMTMSDNDCNWSSCMSWVENGCYRQGTVEMMNSPMVVVAYLTSEKDYYPTPYNVWNNKKWRQLIIVDSDCIVGIKGYPYANSNLTQIAIKWLRDLAVEKLGWNMTQNLTEVLSDETATYYADDGASINLHMYFSTEYMYNDFGCAVHYGYFNNDFLKECMEHNCTSHEIVYSGSSECMICGRLDCGFDEEGFLCCSNCEDKVYCNSCGRYMDRNEEMYEVDGELLCERCYEDSTEICPMCGERHLKDNTYRIHISYKGKLYPNTLWICHDCYNFGYPNSQIFKSCNAKHYFEFHEDWSWKTFFELENVKEECLADIFESWGDFDTAEEVYEECLKQNEDYAIPITEDNCPEYMIYKFTE